MKTTSLAAALVVAIVALMMVQAGYAFTGDGRTYNEGNSADLKYITIGLGDTQYSDAVDSHVTYHTVTVIDNDGRSVRYVPDHTGTVTVSAVEYQVTEVVQFDISVTADTVAIPEYTLSVTVDDSSKMTGTFIASYWTDPSDDGTRVNVLFPAAGIQVGDLTSSSIKLCLFVSASESVSEPAEPLDDIAFKFRTTVGA